MQEIHTIGGGMLFSGVDRRMKPFQNNQHHQASKCPRCNSFNTKFCYYNNYNLSQPRHFCKNCRRYWTKGGILRNVPVGGGSRKSKRSNKSPSSTASETAPATTPTPQPQPPESKSNSNSSSQSSPLTAAVTDAISTTKSNAASNVFTVNPALEPEQVGGIFSKTTGSFMSQVTSNNEAFSFGFGNHVLDASSFRYGSTHQQQHGNDQAHVAQSGGSLGLGQCHWQQQSSDHRCKEFATPSLPDHAAGSLEFSSLQNKSVGGGFGSLDWHTAADQSLFDLSTTVDQHYWTHPHWSDHDNPTLFHLP